MKTWTSEIVHIAYEDGQKIAMLYQNGHVEIYTLRAATKQDISELLESDKSNEHG